MLLANTPIELHETEQRLRISYPLKRNRLAIVIYTILAIAWIVGLILFLWWLFFPVVDRKMDDVPNLLRFFWMVGITLWIYMWTRVLGRRIFRWLQFNMAQREVIFINEKNLMIRRPVSIFGETNAYDREHIGRFYNSNEHRCLAFPYGNVKHVLFGLTVDSQHQQALLTYLNERYYPYFDDEDNDE